MVQRLKEVDVVVIGVGMVGSIVAKELAAAGYKVVGLERGEAREDGTRRGEYDEWDDGNAAHGLSSEPFSYLLGV